MTIHAITLTKYAKRQLRDEVIVSNAASIVAATISKSLTVRGWSIEADPDKLWTKELSQLDGFEYQYMMTLHAEFSKGNDDEPKGDLASIMRKMARTASQQNCGAWTVSHIDDDAYEPPTDNSDDVTGAADQIGYAPLVIPDNFEDFFSHLFGLGSHVARIKSALVAAESSNFANRFHCALIGPPGCGKSDVCRSLQRALGEDAVMEYDATATTAAGAIKDLSEREILPRVIVIEEIEKAPEAAMTFLLAMCDQRGEIRKTTARGTIQRDTRVLVVATVNDLDLFNKLQVGALSSRFANKIFFKRPSREMLAKILSREIAKVNGDMRWITPTLEMCDELNITPEGPRAIITHCLCGREQLLTGEYQTMLRETQPDVDEFTL